MPGAYSEIPYGPALLAGVEAIWHSRSDQHGRYRVLPDGRCDLILRYDDGLDGPQDIIPVITGPSPRYHDVDLRPGSGFVGARFKPGYAAGYLGFSPYLVPPEGLSGASVLARCPWASELVAPVSDHAVLVDRLYRHLAAVAVRTAGPSPRLRAIAGAFRASAGRLGMAEIAEVHGLSVRQLTRIWQEVTGFAPKTYAMILQFQHGLRLIRQSGLGAAAAAHEAGYADQPHMTRAFQRFGGFTPARIPDVTLVTLHG